MAFSIWDLIDPQELDKIDWGLIPPKQVAILFYHIWKNDLEATNLYLSWFKINSDCQSETAYIVRRRKKFNEYSRKLFQEIVFRDGPGCSSCGTFDDVTIDHIIPLSRGGLDALNNLQLLCRSCNARKGARRA